MEATAVILAILLAVVVSGNAARLTGVPLPLIQILIGAGLAVSPLPSVRLDPEIFFLVLLPPLLFLDGWRIPKRDLFEEGRLIVAMAFGLVFFTVLGMGFFIHWLIPAMPLAVSFALAAVLSPTDPVAVAAVAARAPIPSRLMHILEGEALFNDASGLVCLRFAIAAAMTGSFSAPTAILTFVWLAVAGIAVGIAVTLGTTGLQSRVVNRVGEDGGTLTLLSLLIPFGAYLLAEEIGASGILAVAAGGVTMSFVEARGNALASTRMRRAGVWDTVQLAANGAIFVILGEQLPGIVHEAARTAASDGSGVWPLLGYAVCLNLVLLAMRFIWIFSTVHLVRLRHRIRRIEARAVPLPLVVATTLAGVKGTITLAGILTLPLVLSDGTPFPARELAIVLAMSVILTTLVLATFLLPPLLRRLNIHAEKNEEEGLAIEATSAAARRAVEEQRESLVRAGGDAELYAEAAARALRRYDSRDALIGPDEDAIRRGREMVQAVRQLQLAGLQAERRSLFRLQRQRRVDDTLVRRLVREVDLIETRLRGS